MIELRLLRDGGQAPSEVAGALCAFLGQAQHTLDLALYDYKLAGPEAAAVEGALVSAQARGVAVRLAFNVDHAKPIAVPPPPIADPVAVDRLPVPTKGIPGVPDLMHHKYVIVDGHAVWTGSTNWTEDSWSREENVVVTLDSPGVAAVFSQDFEQLWSSGAVQGSGDVEPDPVTVESATVRAWFCPDRGTALAHRIAGALDRAQRRVRIASPVITSGPILGTLAEVVADRRVDVAGVVDATQVHEVFGQWAANGNAAWKTPALLHILGHAPFSGKTSTPYRPGSVHDYMHAKVTVVDDRAFVGSFNLSHSGEMNAENVVEIEDAGLAEQLATFVDEIRSRYPPIDVEREVVT